MMIRKMSIEDIDLVSALETRCFEYPWSEPDIRQELTSNPFSHGFMLELDGKCVGYAFIWIMYEDSQLVRIGIDPEYRKNHLGNALLSYLLDYVRQRNCLNMTLECRVSNEAALRLYHRCGFSSIHLSRGYYSDGEDAWVMKTEFKEEV